MSLFASSFPLLRGSSGRNKLLSRSWLIRRCSSIKKFLSGSKSRARQFRGIVFTGASAAACSALIYFWKPQSDDRIWHPPEHVLEKLQHWASCLNEGPIEEIRDYDDTSMLMCVGIEDDWLASPLFTRVTPPRKIQESNAFLKPNIVDFLSPWEQSSSDDPWILLHLTRSSNFWVRQMGVACLANKVDWEAYKYRNVAQACDYKTVIGLARYDQANDAYFCKQPTLFPSETNVLSDVQNLVRKMPAPESTQSNIAYYRSLALQEEILFQKDPQTMDLLTHFYSMPGEEEDRVDQGLKSCLQTLDAYTSEEGYSRLFVQYHGLAVLQRLHEDRNEEWIQMYILIILNNLSLVPEMGKEFVRAGWVHELRKWAKGDNITFSVMADTILANLDRDWISSELYKNMILLHPTQRNSLPVKADIILVHGLRGGAVKTWRQRSEEARESKPKGCSDCWPKDWLSQEFQDARIISIGYNSSLHQWGDYNPYEADKRTLEGRSEELLKHLKKAGVGSRPIIWLGHSMGGLLIKEILCLSEKNPNLKRILNNTKGIIMYSVPNRGSHLVDTMMYAKYLLFPSVEVQEMSTYSSKLKELNEDFIRLASSYFISCLSFGENVKTDFGRPFPSILLVSQESSDPGTGQFYVVEANHVDVCKPCDKNDSLYQDTLRFLQNILKHVQQ